LALQLPFPFFPYLFADSVIGLLFLTILVVAGLLLLSRTGDIVITRQERIAPGLGERADQFTTNLGRELEKRGYRFKGAGSEVTLRYSDFFTKAETFFHTEREDLRFGFQVSISYGILLVLVLMLTVGLGMLGLIGALAWFKKYSSLKNALDTSVTFAERLTQTQV